MIAQSIPPRGWIYWTAVSRTSALVTVVLLAVVVVFIGVWSVTQIAHSLAADTELDILVLIAVLIEPILSIWLVWWPFTAYEHWMIAMVDPSDGPAWSTRIRRAHAELLRATVEQSEDLQKETFAGGICVFTLTSSAIVFWAVRAHILRPIFELPIGSIESVWRQDFQPSSTNVSLVATDHKRFIALTPGRGRIWRLVRDREDGFRAICQLVGPASLDLSSAR